MTMATVLGGAGFVGSHLVAHLERRGYTVVVPGRDEPLGADRDHGHVFYCIGRTADFRQRLLDTIEAHVCALTGLLRAGNFASLTYLSSTRVYGGADHAGTDARFTVDPADPSDLYNLSKLMGESACLTSGRDTVRVARLSNVYGFKPRTGDFLLSLIDAALTRGRIDLGQALASEKDYIAVDDAVAAIEAVAVRGTRPIYNVAAGANVTHAVILESLQRLTGCTVSVSPDAPCIRFPPIDIASLREEFGLVPTRLETRLASLVSAYRERLAQ